jgi:hypothetical protein
MSHYCGIDLHSNNHVVVVIDEEDKRVFEKRLNNDLSLTLDALAPNSRLSRKARITETHTFIVMEINRKHLRGPS